jgi:hypothetical protein
MKLGRLVGLGLLLIGIIFVAYPNAASPHAKIYVRVDDAGVEVLEAELETTLPLAMLDTYIRNLTIGDRTLDVQAVMGQNVITDYLISNVGTGYTLIRTNPFTQAVPAGETVNIVLTLRDNKKSTIQTVTLQVTAPQPVASYVVGVLGVIFGAVILIMPSRFTPRTRRRTRRR